MHKPTASANFSLPPGARAVLVSLRPDGCQHVTPVPLDCSVLNIERDLINHLNAALFTDEFLLELQDYCAGRLAARGPMDATAAKAAQTMPTNRTLAEQQAGVIFDQIAELATSGQRLSILLAEEDSDPRDLSAYRLALEATISQLGLLADTGSTLVGGVGQYGGKVAAWLLPPIYGSLAAEHAGALADQAMAGAQP